MKCGLDIMIPGLRAHLNPRAIPSDDLPLFFLMCLALGLHTQVHKIHLFSKFHSKLYDITIIEVIKKTIIDNLLPKANLLDKPFKFQMQLKVDRRLDLK